jgi:two-component system, NtrC family, sensor histidine kinase HydH
MLDRKQSPISWIDLVLLVLLAGLALLPATDQFHKQLILATIALFQFLEGRLIAILPKYGRIYTVLVKILLSTLLIDHTGEMGINSSYYPIYFLPIITAAIYFGPIATLSWTALTSVAYCAFLVPAFQQGYELGAEGATILAIRILFFFLAAILVNRFVVENRQQVQRYQALSETLEATNRQLQRAEADARRSERLAALGQLSAGLAHEIRNPLGVIKGSAEMLAEKVKDTSPLASELAGYISSEVNRLNALVARFLDFARPLTVELRAQQISEIVDRSLESVRSQLPNARVQVERHYAKQLPDVLADEQLCDRIFVNLILNAYQAMEAHPDGRPEVLRIEIVPESFKGKAGIGVAIEDTGPGVPAESREQIFNPFFTSKKDGVGLGLSIVAKIVDDHKGWIRLENRSKGGARFHVFFPAAPNAGSERKLEPATIAKRITT